MEAPGEARAEWDLDLTSMPEARCGRLASERALHAHCTGDGGTEDAEQELKQQGGRDEPWCEAVQRDELMQVDCDMRHQHPGLSRDGYEEAANRHQDVL